MGEVLPFTAEHAPGLAALYLRAMRGQQRTPPAALSQYFCDMLLRNPWADPEIPSWVYLEKGTVVGSLGVMPRPMQFRGKPVRMAVSTQYMVDPDFRKGPAAIVLMRKFFSGPQDLSWTDGAADAVHPLWVACGGRVASLYSFQWLRFLRPLGFARDILSRRAPEWLCSAAGLVTAPLDAVAAGLAGSALRPPAVQHRAHLVSPARLFASIREMGFKDPLRPVYDESSFRWLLEETSQAKQSGNFRTLLLPAAAGAAGAVDDRAAAGWAVYWAKPGASAFLLHLEARRKDLFPTALRAVMQDAWEQGCSVIRGYAIPSQSTALTNHACIFRHPGSCALIQSRNPEIVHTVLAGDAALSRLDGECWLRFNGDPWL